MILALAITVGPNRQFMDAEFPVVGFDQGKGKSAGLVIWTCVTATGKHFRVVPAADSYEREAMFSSGPEYVGKLLKVQFFGFTDSGIPRHATGIGFRPMGDM